MVRGKGRASSALLTNVSIVALTVAAGSLPTEAQDAQPNSPPPRAGTLTLDVVEVGGTKFPPRKRRQPSAPARAAPVPPTNAEAAAGAGTTAAPSDTLDERTRPLEERRRSPTSKLVYGREDLERFNERTAGDALRKLPGVVFAGSPAENADIRLRGLEKGYTEILIDGHRTVGGGAERQMDLDLLPADMIERIEVTHNPTAELGGSGIAGTINIVLREIGDKRGGGIRVSGIDSSYGGRPQGSAQWTDRVGNFSYLLSGSIGQRVLGVDKHTDAQTFNSTGNRTAWSWQDEQTRNNVQDIYLAPRFQWKPTAADTFFLNPYLFKTEQLSKVQTDKAKFNTPASGTNAMSDGSSVENTDKNRDIWRIQSGWRRALPLGDMEIKSTLQQSTETKEKSTEEFNAAHVRTKTSAENGTKQDREQALAAKWWAKLDTHAVSIGSDVAERGRDDIKIKTENGATKAAGLGDTFNIGERKYGLWVQDVWKVAPDHVVTAGTRLEKIFTESTDGAGQARRGVISANNPSLHYVWHIDPLHNFRASIAQSVKPPSFDQLSSVVISASGANSSTNPDKTGNPDLKPERALGIEAGIERFLPGRAGVVGLNYFRRNVKDKIETMVVLDPNGRWIERPYNVADARIWGIELDFKTRMDLLGVPSLTLFGNGTRLYSTFLDADAKNKKDPAWVYNIGFAYDIKPWNVRFGADYNVIDKKIKQNDAAKLDVEGIQRRLDWFVTYQPNPMAALKLNVAERRVKRHDIRAVDAKSNVTYTGEQEIVDRSVMLALEVKW